MNPLPQRKKSPEEIAHLRESLGIRPLPETTLPDEEAHVEAPSPPPAPVALDEAVALTPLASSHHRPIRSFKKSEQLPAPAGPPAPSAAIGKIPAHRHSQQELAEARRRDALEVMTHGTYQLPKAAHPALLAIGYVLAIGGAAAPFLLDCISRIVGSYTLSASCGGGYHVLTAASLAALPVAALIHVKRTLSRHHAAFIAVIAFFALVFAVLHYIPQLRHAT